MSTLPEQNRRGRPEPGTAKWLGAQRWFGAKGREISNVRVISQVDIPELDEIGVAGALQVLEIHFAGDSEPHCYQVAVHAPNASRKPGRCGPTTGNGPLPNDAMFDADMTTALLRLIYKQARRGPVRFALEDGVRPATTMGPRLAAALASGDRIPPSLVRPITSEQSNTSVVFDDRLILKLYRRVAPGTNPDLELHRTLTRAGSPHIAPVIGGIEGDLDGATVTYGMLQAFARDSVDGWTTVSGCVNDILDNPTTSDPVTVDGGFVGEAHRIGAAVASVHRDLAAHLGSRPRDARLIADDLNQELDRAMTIAPVLGRHTTRLRRAFDRVARRSSPARVQRVHSDLHLGQLLRTPDTWWLLDFEGEPALPLAERSRLRSPLHDMASLLRSFSYAAHHAQHARAADGPGRARVEAWERLIRGALCEGYASVSGTDPRWDGDLLRAHELARTAYEVAYEAVSRPEWIEIPLAALDRQLGGEPL